MGCFNLREQWYSKLRETCPPHPIHPKWVNPTSPSTQPFDPCPKQMLSLLGAWLKCFHACLVVRLVPLPALSLYKQKDLVSCDIHAIRVSTTPLTNKLVTNYPGLMLSLCETSSTNTHTCRHANQNTSHNSTDCSTQRKKTCSMFKGMGAK